MGLTVLFTYLKIILLQRFSVFSFQLYPNGPLCQRIKMSNDIFAFMIVIFFQNFLNIMTKQDKCHHMFLWFSCPNQDLSYQNDF